MQLVMEQPQELTLVFPNATLEQVLRTVIDVAGTRCVIVKEDDVKHMIDQFYDAKVKAEKKLVNQGELRKIKKCGNATIKRWVSEGLTEIHDGKRVLYDLDELEELLKSKKI